ncbi:MAG: pectate lyase, partial [Candidatus Latescibacteria bacterium]|nr:pectate lyase [Candidatus Latescibacterota bacterium]
MNKVIPIFVLCFLASTLQAQQLAFPTAEGFGRFAKGGRGGDVYHVTTRNDSGHGSLRDGIHSATGPRTIVFDVSGTIELKSNLVIDKPFITIAGQTAPGDGITLKGRSFVLQDTHDIIVRYIRIRYGDKNKENDSDAIRTNGISNVIFDHISATWGVDAIHDLRGE